MKIANHIEATASAHLEGRCVQYLEDLVTHGIHNLSNDFQGDTDEEYEAFSAEFEMQAKILLKKHRTNKGRRL